MKNPPKIFVSIAAYRDPECQHTVKDLFEKAAHPERIRVGICWQIDPDRDADCFTVRTSYSAQLREKRFHARDSRGGCWARAEAHALLEDEEYVLQIDAHMRFVPRWDERMLDTLKTCPSARAALSNSPYGYWPPGKLEVPDPSVRRLITVHELGKENDPQIVHMGSILWPEKNLPQTVMPAAFFIGNFLFIPAQAIRDVPYDPYIYFRGQEPCYAARLWTHGWDIFQAREPLIYHYWESKSRASGTPADYKKMNARAELGKQRVQHLLMGREAPPEALIGIEKYGMGSTRSLADFWTFAGVDLEKRVISEFANRGRWDAGYK